MAAIRAWLPVALGLAGALAGGWLAGGLLGLGLVLIVESSLAVTWGLFRDDGTGQHRVPRPGERTLAEVLDYQRRVQLPPGPERPAQPGSALVAVLPVALIPADRCLARGATLTLVGGDLQPVPLSSAVRRQVFAHVSK